MLIRILLCVTTVAAAVPIWPRPALVESHNTTVRLADSFKITFRCEVSQDVHHAADALRSQLEHDRLAPLEVGRGVKRLKTINSAPAISQLVVVCPSGLKTIAHDAVQPVEKRLALEHYQLAVDDKSATLSSKSALGILRGFQSFAQLVFAVGEIRFIDSTPIKISDEPKFAWRSFLLDTSRNFYPVEAILALLDEMSAVKFSVFHWCVPLLSI